MSATTTHTNTATNEAQFLAPETHQRANGQDQADTAPDREGIRLIPLAKLVPSPLNVRKTGGTNIDELAMLIDAHGLLNPLLVVPHLSKKKPTGKYEVVAGGRRLRALRKLAELGKVGKAEQIPCKTVTREQATAMSMAENSGREAMNVADTVVAFRDMVAAGASVEEVAVAFGITPSDGAAPIEARQRVATPLRAVPAGAGDA